MRIVPEQIARFVTERRFIPLGTDGMGRSDTREALRRHFEIDAANVVVTVLHSLSLDGLVPVESVSKALAMYQLSPGTPSPFFEH
jgi:pyruvate dehydrogenase E1 component